VPNPGGSHNQNQKTGVHIKTKESAKSKKQSVTLKDLKTRKNPKGGYIHDVGTFDTVSAGRSLVVTAGGSNSRC
jgi:hypothetical protein